MRLMLGQERSYKCNTRSVGTIEALLLMSEWHPRSLHFPPDNDGWESEMTISAPLEQERSTGGHSSPNNWLQDVIEPARRSGRMSWMLLGSALSLAHELGIFETEERSMNNNNGDDPVCQTTLRKHRAQQLLYIYINQLSSIIGCTSLMPQSLNRATACGSGSATTAKSEWQTFMDSWMDLTQITKSVKGILFPSASFVKEQVQNGRYLGLLDHFRPLLNQWEARNLETAGQFIIEFHICHYIWESMQLTCFSSHWRPLQYSFH
jgi:hypothetical protein